MKFSQLNLDGNKDKLLIESFFGARTFGYKNEELKRQGLKTVNQSERGLLSVIDFINHRFSSGHFKHSGNGVCVEAPANQGESDELFVHYNYFDPLGTLLIYGFVDLSSPYLFSVPIKLSLLDGRTLNVLGTNPFGNNTVSDSGKHFLKYLPTITKVKNEIVLDSLTIPELSNIDLLRNVLTTVVKSLASDKALTDTALLSEVYALEKQLLQLNLKYWHQLEVLFKQQENVPEIAYQQLESLIVFSKKHISQYANHFGVSLF